MVMTNKNRLLSRIISLALAIVMIVNGCPEMSIKANAETAPKEIWNIDDLYAINNDLTGNYILMTDIDMTEATSPGGEYDINGRGWSPIGSRGIYADGAFTGTFDGNGHTLTGLIINVNTLPAGIDDDTNRCIGLFAYNNGVIKNLTIDDANISYKYGKYSYIGTIAGNNSGRIDNVHISSDMSLATKKDYHSASFPGFATQTGISLYIGGITGKNNGTIINCSADGSINQFFDFEKPTSTSQTSYSHYAFAAGISGGAESGNNIQYCYNKMDITSDYISAGVIADRGSAKDCYNVGNINGKNGRYGISSGGATRCYSIGTSGQYPISSSASTNCYYLNQGGSYATVSGVTALSSSQAIKESMYSGFDFDDVWIIDKAVNYPYPQLRNNRQDAEKIIDSIEWHSEPNKLAYYIDDEIDPAGGILTAYYIDDTSENIEITKDMLSGYSLDSIGQETVTVTFRGHTLTYDISVGVRPTAIGMTLKSEPEKNEFVRGTAFDFSGAVAHIIYDTGYEEDIDITPEMTSGGNIKSSGKQTITYTINGLSVSFDVTVIPVKAENLTLTSLPKKTVYVEGESLDTTGLTGKVTYNNGNVETLKDYSVSGFTSTVGKHIVTITVNNVSASFEVEVVSKVATSIVITKQPTKLSYIVGQDFVSDGMTVVATYNDGTTSEIMDYTVDPIPDTTGTKTLYVHYQSVQTALNVSVIAKQAVSLEVTSLPTKTSYIINEPFLADGLVVTVKYNDGDIKTVTDYTLTGIKTVSVGTKNATVTYMGKVATFAFTVRDKTLIGIEVDEPDKKDYVYGENLDLSGMTVYGIYDNGDKEECSQYTVDGFTGASGSNILVVSLEGFDYSFVVNVHNPLPSWVYIDSPDCTHGGIRVKYCEDCGNVAVTEKVAPLGHTVVIVSAKEATCTETGYTESSYCSVCENTIVEKSIIDLKEHNKSNEWTIITEPGCDTKGIEAKICTVCHTPLETKEIDEKGHSLKKIAGRLATCTESGKTEGTYCEICNETIISQKNIEPLEHILETGWDVVKTPNCTEIGLRQKKCLLCNQIIESEVLPPLGHTFKNYISNNDADCENDGTKTAKCEYCDVNDTVVDEGSAYGHDTKLIAGVVPTCTDSGLSYGLECKVCGKIVKEREILAPTGHERETVWRDVQEVSCLQIGIKELHCADCDIVLLSKEIDIIPHDLLKHEYVKESCTEDGNKEYYECKTCGNCYWDETYILEINDEESVVLAAHHEYDEEWNTGDPRGHWHNCKNCDVHDEPVAHLDEDDDYICEICNGVTNPDGFWIETIPNQEYTGKAIVPQINVYDCKKLLVLNKDYTIKIKNNINVGQATVTVTGKGNYSSVETEKFEIYAKDISSDEFECDFTSVKATGKIQSPKPILWWNGKAVATSNYTCTYYATDDEGNIKGDAQTSISNVGNYIVEIHGIKNFTGDRTSQLKIVDSQKPVSKLTVSKVASQIYTGHELTPKVTVKDGKKTLTEGADYIVEYYDNINIGTATVIITGINLYSGVKRTTFSIVGTPITKASVKGIATKVTFTGKDITFDNLQLYIKATKNTPQIDLKEGIHYTVSYTNNKNAGKATVVFKGINGYTGELKKTFNIVAFNIAEDFEDQIKVSLESNTVVFCKGGAKPVINASFTTSEGIVIPLKEKTDYTLSYVNNSAVNDGTNPKKIPQVKVTFKGNYKGNVSKKYVITSKDFSDLTASAQDVAYSASAGKFKSSIKITDTDGKTLVAGKDYNSKLIYTYEDGTEVSSYDIVPVGTVLTVKARAIGNYTGDISCQYRITKAVLGKATISIDSQFYTGKEIEVNEKDITVKYGQNTLEMGKDYEIVPGSYVNNINKGTASVTIRGLGNYGGTKTVKFTIKAKGFLWWWR